MSARTLSISVHRLILVSASGLMTASAATPLPGWYGGPDSTYQAYLYTTNSQTPAANTLENPYGTPVSTVTLGNFSAGWQSSSDPIAQNGATSDGAWDLGVAGSLAIQMLAAPSPPPPGSYYRTYFSVYSIAYEAAGFVELPTFEVLGLNPVDLIRTQSLVLNKPPGASYQGIQWTGYVDHLTNNAFTFRLNASPTTLSVVDSFEVFTRYTVIPEPSLGMLLLGPALWCFFRRRRT